MKKKNILLIIPNLGKGGAQVVFREQLNYFKDQFNVIGCTFNWRGSFLEDKQLSIVSLDVPGGDTLPEKAFYFIKRIFKLRKIKKEFNIDISISHLEGADYVNLLSFTHDKKICWIHGSKQADRNISGYLGWLRKKILIPLLYKKSSLIITVSEGIRHEFINSFEFQPKLLRTIYNGFNIESIQRQANIDVPELKQLAQSHKIIITHCRLARQKNLHALIEIYTQLIRPKKTKLIIIGDGELREDLINSTRSLGLQVYIAWEQMNFHEEYDLYFLGHQNNPFKFLSNADLYVMTSLWEGFPLSLCEAMICGVPVVAADCFTGPREIIAPDLKTEQPITDLYSSPFGILMPLPDNKKSISFWAKSLDDILRNPELRKLLSENGKLRSADFASKTIYNQWKELIYHC